MHEPCFVKSPAYQGFQSFCISDRFENHEVFWTEPLIHAKVRTDGVIGMTFPRGLASYQTGVIGISEKHVAKK